MKSNIIPFTNTANLNTFAERRMMIFCISMLGESCLICGTILIFKGYNAELLIGGVVSAISGLLGAIVGRATAPQQDMTVSAGPPAQIKLSQPQAEPETEEQPSINNLVA